MNLPNQSIADTNMALQVGKIAQKLCTATSYCRVFAARYAKKMGGGAGGKGNVQLVQKPKLEVETDVSKLTTYCCGANIYTTGTDPKLKPDEEYPEWLWSLRLDRKPPELTELDPNDYKYWRRLRKLTIRQNNKLMKINRLKK